MSTTRRDLLTLFVLGVAVNALAAVFVVQPGYMDAHYYFGGALRLARGHGFTEPYVWNYFSPLRELPAPSHLYWMPLTSLVAAPFIALAEALAGGPLPNALAFRAAQVPMALAASALPLLSYGVAHTFSGERRHAWSAALLTLFSAFYFPFWTNTDSFALFGLCAAGSLFAFHHSASSPAPRRWWFFSGLLAGLAHLARADGLLVMLCLLLFNAAIHLRLQSPISNLQPPTCNLQSATLFLLAGYLLPMAPWFLRNLLVVGSPLAPNGARALWLTNYNELFTYHPEQLTPGRYLAHGWEQMLRDKWETFGVNFGNLAAAQAGIIAFPFFLMGLWALRRHPLAQLAALYGAALFAAMTFAFTFPGARGGYFHSGAALLPFVSALAVAGLDAAVEAVARVLKHWQPQRSKPVFTLLLVLGAMTLTGLRFLPQSGAGATADAVYAEVGQWLLRAEGPGAVVAVNNPPAFYYHTGLASIAIPADNVETLLRAMADFGARWLVLDANVAEGLAGLAADPTSEPRLQLRATFGDTYVLERAP